MLCIAVSVRRLKTVIVSIFLLLIIIVFLNSESYEENNIPSVKDPSIQPSKPSLEETTTEEYDYEEISIPLWGEFLPTDVRFEKDIFFLETKGYKVNHNDEIIKFYFFIRVGTLSAREGCVIESALKANQHRVVWVLLAGANSSR